MSYVLSVFAACILAIQLVIESRPRLPSSILPVLALAFWVAGFLCILWSFSKGVNPFNALRQVDPSLLFGGPARVLFTVCLVSARGLSVAEKFGLAVAAQLSIGAVIDHFGLLDQQVAKLGIQKAVGISLLLVGIFLLSKR